MRRSRVLCIMVVVALAGVLAGASLSGCGKGVIIPEDAKAAIQDAAEYADDLVAHYEAYRQAATGTTNQAGESASESQSGTLSTQSRSYEEGSAELAAGIERIQKDLDALESSGVAFAGQDQAIAAMKNLQGAMSYELDILEAQSNASAAAQGTGTAAAMQVIDALYGEYKKITPPDCLKNYLEYTLEAMPTIYSALVYSLQGNSSILNQYASTELLSWWFTKQSAYDAESNEILIRQCEESKGMLESIGSGIVPNGNPKADIDIIDEIAPNLYPSLDSAVILGVTSYGDDKSILVEAEVAGLSQKFEQKYDLAQGYNYIPIKPALLTADKMPDLSNDSTTQINVKVVDADSGDVIAQESHETKLLSMYDFRWTNDEFGNTAAFDILAWLRPQAEEVNAVNRAAADILGDWTNGQDRSLAGYQYGTDVLKTLQQVAAIQKAISDTGVVYVMDNYSFNSDQHVLTPDAVVQKKQGLCIETTLLMASCLMSAGMHPLIIITPSHAQVAVETYSGSGNYFLIETTTLPYDGINVKGDPSDPASYNGLLASAKTTSGDRYYWTTAGSSDEWQTYFSNVGDGSDQLGGIFVIDCNLQQIMGIQGLENL